MADVGQAEKEKKLVAVKEAVSAVNKKHTSSLDIPTSSDNAPTESTSALPTVWVQTHSQVSLAAAYRSLQSLWDI